MGVWWLVTLLAGVSLVLLFGRICTFLHSLHVHLHPSHVNLAKKYGYWAVVTGSTDGIGRAYALELAKRGLNVFLISRSIAKLQLVTQEIESKFDVKTKTCEVDFSKGEEVFNKIKEALKDIPVSILVNNVGKQYSYPMYLCEVSEKQLWEIIEINVGATTMMSRIVIPGMQQRGRGAVVNISSASEYQPLPLMTVYAATKAFVKSFSEALRYEYQNDGITVQHLSPMFINTKMNSFSSRLQKNSLFVPSAETYAYHAVNTLGRANSSTGYWAHDLQSMLTMMVPVWLRTQIGGLMNQNFRQEYLASLENQKCLT